MYEFTIENRHTNEETYIFGYNINNAFSRTKLNPNDWQVVNAEYID